MERGKYILFEGGEGCGKSTQSELFYEHLKNNGVNCISTREPGGTPDAEEIRRLILDSTKSFSMISKFFLFEAARAEIYEKVIRPNLSNGTSVISDRSGYSTLAYQGYGSGIDLDLIRRANNLATLGIKPDLLILIDIPAEVGLSQALKRDLGKKDSIESEGLEFHRRVNRGYLEIAAQNPDTAIVIPYRQGDADGMQEEIRGHIRRSLNLEI